MDSLKQAAWAALERNDVGAAHDACVHALSFNPNDMEVLGTLGFILHSIGKFADAESVFLKMTNIDPDQGPFWVNLGTSRRCMGQLDEALAAFTRAAALGENSADFYFNVGLTHVDRKDFESGRAVLSQAAALAPEDAEIRYQYALCCYERIRTEEALAALDGWESLADTTNELVANIGLLLMKLGEATRAEPAIRRALAANPSDPLTLLTLVQLLERTNRLSEAERQMSQLQSNPRSHSLGSDLLLMQAQLAQRNSRHDLAVELFGKLIADCKEEQLRHLLQFPLAKSLDVLGRYKEAFQTLIDAHASQAQLLKLTAPMATVRGAPTMTVTRFGVDPDDVSRWTDHETSSIEQSPVFIVAFPRSGTTLLELTLDAHPHLASMDEQPFVQNALDEMITAGAQYPEGLAKLSQADLNGIRARYWQRTNRKVALAPGQRLLDKNPLNMLRLPAIRRLFPNSLILVAVRHPCDVILSCFMQHFRTPDFALLCQDLPTLATGYRHCFDFWYQQQALLKPMTLELRYESFVADFENQVRAVLEFLQLPWSDAMLKPQKHAQKKGFISTPSYSQVIEPVNEKAVGRWRHYSEHFADIIPILQPLLSRWGYEGAESSNSK